MPLTVGHCVPEDAGELAAVYLATYGHLSRFHATYHRVPLKNLLKTFDDDIRKGIEMQNHPTPTQEVHYLKVTDPETHAIIAFAIWKYLPCGYRVDEDGQAQVKAVLDDGTNEQLLHDFCRMTGDLRSAHPGRHEAHWCTYVRFSITFFPLTKSHTFERESRRFVLHTNTISVMSY